MQIFALKILHTFYTHHGKSPMKSAFLDNSLRCKGKISLTYFLTCQFHFSYGFHHAIVLLTRHLRDLDVRICKK